MANSARSINIGGDVNDANYRYKMPSLITKIEGRGNGIKTRIINMKEVSRALVRDPAYTTKFFGCELCAQSKYSEEDGSGVVNGAFDEARMQELLMKKFLPHFVLCKKCGNPETNLHVKGTDIYMMCGACGGRTDVNPQQKLCTFIINHPPKKEKSKSSSSSSKDKKTKSKDESVKKTKKEDDNGSNDDDQMAQDSEDDGGDWSMDTSKEAMEARRMEMVGESQALQSMVIVASELKLSDSGPTSPTTPTSPVAPISAPAAAESGPEKVAKAAKPVDESKPHEYEEDSEEDPDTLPSFEDYVRKFKRMARNKAAEKNSDYLTILNDFVARYPMDVTVSAQVLVVSLLQDSKDMPKELKKRSKLIRSWMKSGAEVAQFAVLVGWERMVQSNASLGAKTSMVFKVLYDEEVVEESVFLTWEKAAKKSTRLVPKDVAASVRAEAAKFVEWLKNAEEEEEEEEGDK